MRGLAGNGEGKLLSVDPFTISDALQVLPLLYLQQDKRDAVKSTLYKPDCW